VGLAWLDAGIVPFSTLDYLENKKLWEKWFPFEFICENMPGQFRGWFNALFWASVTLTGKTPFKTILGYETLKQEKWEINYFEFQNSVDHFIKYDYRSRWEAN
jgi:isoleucyl-tRNA synthetase